MDAFEKKLISFFSQFKLRHYRKRDIILHEDDIPPGMFYIQTGYLRLYSYSKDGEELTRILLGPGDITPIRSVLANKKVDYYLETITPVTCYCAPKETFMEFLKTDPEILLGIIQYALDRMGALYRRMEYFAFGNAYEKVAIIVDMLTNRFGLKEKDAVLIDIPLTQKDIASMVGLSRETTNIQLEKLRKKGILEYVEHRHIKILDLKKLKEEARLS